MDKKTYILILCILGPYILGVVGNASFAIFEWHEFGRWMLGIISLIGFTVVFVEMKPDPPKNDYKEKN